MYKKHLDILTNIIGGVETGGQVYGNRNYASYAGPGKNTENEKTCTLGWAGNYGERARKLCRMILDRDPVAFRNADSARIEYKLSMNWETIKWYPTEKEKCALIAIITTPEGKKCQDELFQELAQTYIKNAEEYGVTNIPDQMMWCEIEHLGGLKPVKRIFARSAKPYTPDSIFASLMLDQKDTSNNNQVGDKIFQSRHECCVKWIKKYVEDAGEEKVHMISNCGHDENGKYTGGKAGDQTKNEWAIIPWYNRPWNCILRHPDRAVGNMLAELARKAAQNNLIGYDQNQRGTYWQHLKASNYDPAQITIACEADCSSGVAANVKAAGYRIGRKELQSVSADCYTGNLRKALKAAGFDVFTSAKYLTSPDYLLPGDILLYEGHHTATNLDTGSKATETTSSAGGTETTKNNTTSGGTCEVKLKSFVKGNKDNQIKTIQRILNALGYKGKDGKPLKEDGELGGNTEYAIARFQKDKKLQINTYGTVGSKTWTALLNCA